MAAMTIHILHHQCTRRLGMIILFALYFAHGAWLGTQFPSKLFDMYPPFFFVLQITELE
jgi:hypothetical protein